MEDKNLNPGHTPEDMPTLNLENFENQPQEAEILEPLFLELPSSEPQTSDIPHEEPAEDNAVLDTPAQEIPGEAPPSADSQEADQAVSLAAEEESPLDLPPESSEYLPPKDFSEFDIPIEEPAPAQPLDSTMVFDPGLVESTANSGGMESPYQEPNLTSYVESNPEPETTPPVQAQSQAANGEAPPVRKGRPKSKKGDGLFGLPHLLATLLWLAIIVAIGVSLGRMLWLCASDVLAFGRDDKEVTITIDSDDTIDEIAEKLHEKGLIKYPGLFKLYANIAVDDGEIAPGNYTLKTILDYHALVSSMSSSSSHRAVVEDVLIPEGYSCRQIYELLEQNGICTVAELESYAASGEFQDFWFLEGVERGDKYCLEGFLFPDTYDFYANSTPREALGKMLLGFNSRIDQEEITTQLAALNQRLSDKMKANGCSEEMIAENQITLYRLLTVASLIEEETAGTSESPMIASVIYNRLAQNEVYERYLGIDAAIIYVTGDAENIDTGIDSPYNTYIHAGLTPTPISNPGLSSINAALDFADSDYYYYVLNPETQLHQFSKTYEEHQQWIEQFRGES